MAEINKLQIESRRCSLKKKKRKQKGHNLKENFNNSPF